MNSTRHNLQLHPIILFFFLHFHFSSKSNMRFKKGSMVEVSTKEMDLLGEWWCAEIVEDHGDDGYRVRHHCSKFFPRPGVDRVPTEAVRPCPPPQKRVCLSWAVGEVVEVLDYKCWRVAMVKEVLKDRSYYVQVIGSTYAFKVSKSSIRARKEWINNDWVLLSQGARIDENVLSRMREEIDAPRKSDFSHKWIRKRPFRHTQSTDITVPEAHVEKVQRVAVNDRDSSLCSGKVDTPVSLMWDHQGKAISSSSSNASNRQDEYAQHFPYVYEQLGITVDENGDLWIGPDVKITFP